jgi:hypothetical protein
MQNPNPKCEKECRFSYGPTVTTAMYYSPVFDKHGNNLNPDGNTSFSEVSCYVCHQSWYASTQYGKTTFKLIEK